MKKMLMLVFIFVFTTLAFSQQLVEEKAKKIVNKALTHVVLDYGRINIKHGYYKMEYKLVYNGKKISKAEKKVKKTPNMKSGQLLLDFEKELSSKLKSAILDKAEYDKDANIWKVYISLPDVKTDEIKVDGTTGEILSH
jgi:arginyl-tRNA synthetase